MHPAPRAEERGAAAVVESSLNFLLLAPMAPRPPTPGVGQLDYPAAGWVPFRVAPASIHAHRCPLLDAPRRAAGFPAASRVLPPFAARSSSVAAAPQERLFGCSRNAPVASAEK
eukprot:14186289-Alexandrium_andersonii.AAC.1